METLGVTDGNRRNRPKVPHEKCPDHLESMILGQCPSLVSMGGPSMGRWWLGGPPVGRYLLPWDPMGTLMYPYLGDMYLYLVGR